MPEGEPGSVEGVGRFARVARLDAYAASASRLLMAVMMARAVDTGKSSVALLCLLVGPIRGHQAMSAVVGGRRAEGERRHPRGRCVLTSWRPATICLLSAARMAVETRSTCQWSAQ